MKTSELTGAALDWAVQQCEGARRDINFAWWTEDYSPSTDWSQGGPIIERECISVDWMARMVWDARIYVPDEEPWQADGATMLIAAMRCYCCAKLGDEIDIPEELCQQQSS